MRKVNYKTVRSCKRTTNEIRKREEILKQQEELFVKVDELKQKKESY